MKKSVRPQHLLFLIMLVAYGLRLLLIVNGGQFYFPDEKRYKRSLAVAEHIRDGDFSSAVNRLLGYERHPGIAVAELLPALFHRIIHGLSHEGDLYWDWGIDQQILSLDFRISALIFAIPSILSMGMIYLIACQAGANETEALLGAFLLAASNSFFTWSRHLLPYDISMLLGLTAIYFALRLDGSRVVHGLGVGLLAFLTFWIYNGHFTLVIIIGLLYSVFLARSSGQMLVRALTMVSSGLLLFIPIAAFNALALNIDIISSMIEFSGTVTQGSYGEGTVFPFLYFRDAESGIALVWLIGLALAGWRIWRQPESAHRRRGLLWFACLMTLWLIMSLLSVGMREMTLYGRTVRVLVPFMVMLSAYAFAPHLLRYGTRAVVSFVVVVSVLALANFIPAIQQQYPIEIARQVYQEYDDVSFETTLGSSSRMYGIVLPEVPTARYRLINAGFYYPINKRGDHPEGEVLLDVSHPYNYKPWQYEILKPAMREFLDRYPISIWLIDTQAAADK